MSTEAYDSLDSLEKRVRMLEKGEINTISIAPGAGRTDQSEFGKLREYKRNLKRAERAAPDYGGGDDAS